MRTYFDYHRNILDNMFDRPDLSATAAVLADPTRSRMLNALMDGRALTATELALEGDVVPSTASSHLAKLADAGLIAITKQGRHRYFRIATPEVAAMLESFTSFAVQSGRVPVRTGPRDDGMRRARVCYDHLAGEAGVTLYASMRARRFVREAHDTVALTTSGEKWLGDFGVDLHALRARRRPLCRTCLDWSERRSHLAGAVGSAILDRLFALRWARREVGSRAITFTHRGEEFLEKL